MNKDDLIVELRQKIAKLEQEIREALKRLPAHSVRPHQLIAIEDMEDELESKKQELNNILQK